GSFMPVPSEIILPFSGYLVFRGEFTLITVALIASLGQVAGVIITYSIARFYGIDFLYKYGKYFFVTKKDIEKANKLFEDYGARIIFASRLIPGIRGFIPIPAGIAKMKFISFIAYVFTGSFIYSLILTYAGVWGGENWDWLAPYFRRFDWILAIFVIMFLWWWIRRYIKEIKSEQIV
ncbi:MAG: DedA family protein, partial [Candidatus Spechtbacterales bacterium]